MGISPCIPSRSGRKNPIPHDTDLYRKRHRIENTFARLKDWRRIATRYDRCPILFLSACALAATVIYRLWVLTLLYLDAAMFTPSLAPAKVSDEVVRDV
jgi:IS4 transposase